MTEVSYFLAVDVGTSRIAAATARIAADGSIVTAPFALGRKSDSVATVVFVAEDGDLSFGDVAERRGVAQPERLIREFKRSIGDEVPLVVGGRSLPAEQLYALTVAAIVELVTEREGPAAGGGLPDAPDRLGRPPARDDPVSAAPRRSRRRRTHHRTRGRRAPLRGDAVVRARPDPRGVRPRWRHVRHRRSCARRSTGRSAWSASRSESTTSAARTSTMPSCATPFRHRTWMSHPSRSTIPTPAWLSPSSVANASTPRKRCRSTPRRPSPCSFLPCTPRCASRGRSSRR